MREFLSGGFQIARAHRIGAAAKGGFKRICLPQRGRGTKQQQQAQRATHGGKRADHRGSERTLLESSWCEQRLSSKLSKRLLRRKTGFSRGCPDLKRYTSSGPGVSRPCGK